MTEIVQDTIWLGSARDAEDENFLLQNKITHVVNVGGSHAQSQNMLPFIKYFKIDALDAPGYPILDNHLSVFSTIMDQALADPENKVLVHCYAGINRSTTLLIAYLKKIYKHLNLIQHVKSLRPIVLTNQSFFNVLQLVED
jgi:atypical dual specificity phosphatase